MGRISQAVKDKVIELRAQEHDVAYISDLTGLSKSSVERIIEDDEEKVNPEEELTNEVEDAVQDDPSTLRYWMEFWKGKYLEVHAELVELQHLNEE